MFRRKKRTPLKEAPQLIGSYRLVRKLGEGGMGVVYEAVDERLQRSVAIKMLRDVTADPRQRDRLWREARTAAGINHPNICQVYEIGEEQDNVFIAMEHLEGEPLSARIKRGPIPLRESLDLALGILSALDALHQRGIIHRDLKPSNVFLTEHGIKLLDFGLARPRLIEDSDGHQQVTMTGAIVGTPSYMSPEQWSNGSLGPYSDIFSLGAILFEMLTGKPVFKGGTVMEVCRAIMNDEPAPLSGGTEVVAIDRVIQKALAKDAQRRYPDARAMSDAIRAVNQEPDRVVDSTVRKTTRIVVLPFRLLRPDPEVDFLGVSLPDAITISLSTIGSLVIRSSAAASRYAGDHLDLQAIASQAGVDAVVSGTLLRAGDQVRVVCQLIEAPSGTVLCSRTSQAPLGDIFRLQDDLAREIAQSLSLPLSAEGKGPLQRDVPKSAEAYQFYLRANQLGQNLRLLEDARSLYLSALREDPDYSPAWARLGRVYRVMAKYGQGDPEDIYPLAEQAFAKALELNPDLTLAHHLLTNLEVENGRAQEAMVRLLRRAHTRAEDPELFAGLVMACRFCGLLEASAAADRIARRLDPGIRTSVSYTYWMMGDYEKAMLFDDDDMRFVTLYSLPMLGREGEAISRLRELRESQPPGLLAAILGGYLAAVEGDRDGCLEADRLLAESGFRDPEGVFYLSRCLARVKETGPAIRVLDQVVAKGFWCPTLMARDPWLESLRGDPEFERLLQAARRGHHDAGAAFSRERGPQLLGIDPSATQWNRQVDP